MDDTTGELVGWVTAGPNTRAVYVVSQFDGFWWRVEGPGPVIAATGPYATYTEAADAGRAAIGVDGAALFDMVRKMAEE